MKNCVYDKSEFISARSIHLQFDVDAPSIDLRIYRCMNGGPHHMFDY